MCKLSNGLIREFHTLCFFHQFNRHRLCFQTLFHLDKIGDLIQEPEIDLIDGMDFFQCITTTNSLCDTEKTSVINSI